MSLDGGCPLIGNFQLAGISPAVRIDSHLHLIELEHGLFANPGWNARTIALLKKVSQRMDVAAISRRE